MLAEVRTVFPSFTERFEGKTSWMYLDCGDITPFNPIGAGLVTTGCGNLLEPISQALRLPWKVAGQLAEASEISAEWNFVKTLQSAKSCGGGWFKSQTKLRLDDADIDALTFSRLDMNEAQLRAGFGEWDSFPAPAQLGILSMAWAMGPAFGFPHFRAAANTGDWATCAGPDGDANADSACRGEAWMRDVTNLGLRSRNLMNKRLFSAARDGVALATVLA